ncbi:MAG: cytochrome c [Bacteroidota bacterium]
MRTHLLILTVFLFALFCNCNTGKKAILNSSLLPGAIYTIDITRDTVLHTAKGAIITIPKGALKTKSATVDLEIKEAYTIVDMLQGGLVTKAGKDPLSSGGMISINPTGENTDVTITEEISVAIPTKYRQDGMQVYKGDKNSDGTIDWTDPKPIDKVETPDSIKAGEALFRNNCSSCHAIDKEATAPPLAFLRQRRERFWIDHFILNAGNLINDQDPLASCLYEHYNRAAMPAYSNFSLKDIDAILDYIDHQSASIDPNSIPDFGKSFDSCEVYYRLIKQLRQERQRMTWDTNKFSRVERNSNTTRAILNSSQDALIVPVASLEKELVSPADIKPVYYQIKIETWGWYNVDILMKNLPGFENSELMVRVMGKYKSEVTLYLAIPSQKILLDGGLLSGSADTYGFYTKDGKIPLPQNVKAYIIALLEQDGQLFFGKTDFTTGLSQSPEITLQALTTDSVNIQIKLLDMPDFAFKASATKNGDSIRRVDIKIAELEGLKPQGCDCSCLTRYMEDKRDTAIQDLLQAY